MDLIIWVLLGIIAIVVAWLLLTYNGFVTLKVRGKNALAQIDVQLKRRNYLFPNLGATVKGYAKHEKTVFANVPRASAAMDQDGTLAEPALTRLALVSKGKTAVYFARHNKRLGHRHELGGKKGRYPEKAAKIARKVLENALANAVAIGIQTPYVAHICANKHRTFPRLAPKGRRGRNDYETARVEIVLKEMEAERAEVTKKQPKLLKLKMEAEKMAEKAKKAEKQKTETEKQKMTV